MANNVVELLDKLDDEGLQGVIDRSNELLKERDRQRKEKALEQARAILSGVGLSLKDVATGKKNGNKGPVYHSGRQYQHPANKALTWNAKGQKPTWLRELETQGGKAVEPA
jgi:DNA-binding protein H-NS